MAGAIQGFTCVTTLVMADCDSLLLPPGGGGCAVKGILNLCHTMLALSALTCTPIPTLILIHLPPRLGHESGWGYSVCCFGPPELSAQPGNHCSEIDQVIRLRKAHLQKEGEMENLRKKRHLDFLDILLFARVSMCMCVGGALRF